MGTEWARILVVENGADTRHVTENLLAQAGYYVRGADTIAEALAFLMDDRFDIVLSDLILPDGNGFDLMRKVTSTRAVTRGIALTGWGSTSDFDDTWSAGFSARLLKPVDQSSMVETIERVLTERDLVDATFS